MFTKKDQMVVHKTSLNTFENIVLSQIIFSHNRVKRQTSNIMISGKCQNTWKANRTYPHTHGPRKKSQGKLENIPDLIVMKMQFIKICKTQLR